MGIKVVAYTNTSPTSIDNPWLLHKQISMPILLSWNTLYHKKLNWDAFWQYIEYHELQPGETKESVLQHAMDLHYDGFVYDKESWITSWEIQSNNQTNYTNRYSYTLPYRKGDEYPLHITYYFQDGKSYYYRANYGSECLPGPCGFWKHDIQLFTK